MSSMCVLSGLEAQENQGTALCLVISINDIEIESGDNLLAS